MNNEIDVIKFFGGFQNKSEQEIKKITEIYNDVQSRKNCDFVEYRGCQPWKPNRNFNQFKLNCEDLKISLEDFNELKHIIEQAWKFCDTLLIYSAQENNQFVLDYCLIGQRMNWSVGDQYWLVYNMAKLRFEIRKADLKKWTPLAKMFVDDNLQLRFKLSYLKSHEIDDNFINVDLYESCDFTQISINSFPDRIELHILNKQPYFKSHSQILDYYFYCSPMYKNKKNRRAISDLSFTKRWQLRCLTDCIKDSYLDIRRYNVCDESKQDMQLVYNNFIKYSHELKCCQKSFAQKKESQFNYVRTNKKID